MFKQFSIFKLIYEMLKHCACLGLFVCVLRISGQSGCDALYCRATRIVQFNDLLVASGVRWNRTLSRFDCFRLCYDDRKCVSFQHKSASDQCRGYNTSFTDPGLVQTSPEVGTRLYSMCGATQRLQSECGNDEDCKEMEKVCVEGVCQLPSLIAISPVSYSLGGEVGVLVNSLSAGLGKDKARSVISDCFQHGEEYLGCYLDPRNDHLWNNTFRDMSLMTNQLCIDFCVRDNYKLAGTWYYYDCFCGNVIRPGYPLATEGDCWAGCYGNATQMCGGDGYLSVYATGL